MRDDSQAELAAGQTAIVFAALELLIDKGLLSRSEVAAKYQDLLKQAEAGGTKADRPILHLLSLLNAETKRRPVEGR